MDSEHEVLIVGGGPAGLGAAMALGRLRRSALVCDDFRPRNLPAAHMHNFPGAEGASPLEWRKLARRDVERYGSIRFFEGSVSRIVEDAGGFKARLSSGSSVAAKKVVLAYGIQDDLLPIPGIKELWGKSVFHCPFCHGYESRDRRIGLIVDGAPAMHMLPMLHGLSSDLILFTNGKSQLTAEQRGILERRRVGLIEHPVERLAHRGEELEGLWAGGELVTCDVVFAPGRLPFRMKSDLGESLGCERTEMGLYKVTEGNRTTVPGVYAAGDAMTLHQSVLNAVATGQAAGVAAVQDLLSQAFNAAVSGP